MKNLQTYKEYLFESQVIYDLMYHGGNVDFTKPMYFSDSIIIASSYGKISGPYTIKLKKSVIIDFISAEGWRLPEESARVEVKKLGMSLSDFDKYLEHPDIKSIKTDYFVKAAKDKGFDGVIFINIQDPGSLSVKGYKYIRTTNIVAIYPKSSVRLNK